MRTAFVHASIVACALFCYGCPDRTYRPLLSHSVFDDKMRGAWVGQMVGVSYGAPYEFRSNAKTIDTPLRAWSPPFIENAIGQDDLHVEMTWLACLEDHGLDVTSAQAGLAFAAKYTELCHANKAGAENVRNGILPPASGHPDHNPHANDIDYQIECDLIGILCPGLPSEANRLGEVFGRITNSGDGLYGGLFIQGMYCEAYFESHDPVKVVDAGLACIPAKSLYARCIRDVLRLHREHPDDWRAAWTFIETTYDDDRDCTPGPFNIDAHVNGAYVVIGLLYGGDDFWRVCELATRCGQDTDCNAASAAGVWGCMHGLASIPREAHAHLPKIADRKFAHARYDYNALIGACRRMTEKIVVRAGGKITPDGYAIPIVRPTPPPLEQWESPPTPERAPT